MLRSSLLQRAAVSCRAVALGGRSVVKASRSLASPASQGSPAAAAVTVAGVSARPLHAVLRLYSSQAAAVAPDASEEGTAAPDTVTRFPDLHHLGVHPVLVRSITEGMRFEHMTDVQAATINPALAGKDLIAQAKTGTGKTLAFLVPVMQRIIAQDQVLATKQASRDARSSDIRAIIISPTRELAEQIAAEARRLAGNTGLVVQCATGGTQKRMMLLMTRRMGCHILVATPGRLNDLLGDPESGIAAPQLGALVLDEADRMLEVGFKDELESIIGRLPRRDQVPRQTLLFSATIPKDVVGVARSYIDPGNFSFVQTIKADDVATHEKVPQSIVRCRGIENLMPTLLEMIRRQTAASRNNAEGRRPFKAIVFLATSNDVVLHAEAFRELSKTDKDLPRTFQIHARLLQRSRTRAAELFKEATEGVLFSTDVSARGMDYPGVTHVIQIGAPRDQESYIHRLGRTGRGHNSGEGWLLISQADLPHARRTLGTLPIKPSSEYDTIAGFDAAAAVDGEKPAAFQDLTNVLRQVSPRLLNNAYISSFGQRSDAPYIQSINNCATLLWGMDAPPVVSSNFANKLGGAMHLLNIGIPQYFDDGDNLNSGGGRGGFGRGGSGGFGGRGSFNRGDSGGFGGRSGTGGFDRGRSGGFGDRGGRGGFDRERSGGFGGGFGGRGGSGGSDRGSSGGFDRRSSGGFDRGSSGGFGDRGGSGGFDRRSSGGSDRGSSGGFDRRSSGGFDRGSSGGFDRGNSGGFGDRGGSGGFDRRSSGGFSRGESGGFDRGNSRSFDRGGGGRGGSGGFSRGGFGESERGNRSGGYGRGGSEGFSRGDSGGFDRGNSRSFDRGGGGRGGSGGFSRGGSGFSRGGRSDGFSRGGSRGSDV